MSSSLNASNHGDITALRLKLKTNGFSPIPVNGKIPLVSGWQTMLDASDDEISRWAAKHSSSLNTGIITKRAPTIDVDILHEEAASAVEALVREGFGSGRGRLLRRIGLPPKRAFVFRTEEPFTKLFARFKAPDGTSHKVEILCDGQQVVVAGIHPDARKPYAWDGGEPWSVARPELVELTETSARSFLADAAELLAERFGFTLVAGTVRDEAEREMMLNRDAGRGTSDDPDDSFPPPERAEVVAALAAVPSDDENIWFEVGCALQWCVRYEALQGDFARKLFHRWSVRSGKYKETECWKKWEHCGTQHARGGFTVATIFHYADQHQPEWREQYRRAKEEAREEDQAEAEQPRTKELLQSSAEFVANYTPPDYLVDGLIQRRYVYSLTAPTGDGKTCVVLLLALLCALGKSLGSREVDKGRVLFFAGENPDDVRARWIKLCEEMNVDPNTVDVFFLPGSPPISNKEIRKRINEESARKGPFGLLIVDTSAAYFKGDDENSNAQLGEHARMLRSFVNLPGGPTVIVTCHPVKNPDRTNLLPRGGGAFLAEVDGNLVLVREPGRMSVEMHWHGKFRGPDFAPMPFKLASSTSDKLKDTKGRPVWTVTAHPMTEAEGAAMQAAGRSREDQLLTLLHSQHGLSMRDMAKELGWTYQTGEPNQSLVQRILKSLEKDKLVQNKRGTYSLTSKGREAVGEIRDPTL